MSMNYTTIPHEFYDEFDCLTDAQFGALIRGMLSYHITGDEPPLALPEKMFWKRVKNYVDRCTQSYQKKCAANAENGKLGGRPPKPKETEKTQSVLAEPEETEKSHTKTKNQKPKTKTKTEDTPHTPQGEEQVREQDFDKFWALYPKKKSKGQARTAWNKLNPSAETVRAIMEKLPLLIASEDWKKSGGQYIPYPATWINAEGWNDEVARPAISEYTPKQAYDPGTAELAAINNLLKLRDELGKED